MPKKIGLEIGSKFDRLTVERYLGASGGYSYYQCRCVCGNLVDAMRSNLTSGNTTSCGCARTKHGMSRKKIHHVWREMRQRCRNPKNSAYHNYGARGIVVCDRWEKFENFLEDMGLPPSDGQRYTVERRDNFGPYCKDNCKWATHREQRNNTRANHLLTFNGKTQSLRMWAAELGINPNTLNNRINRAKVPLERALNPLPMK